MRYKKIISLFSTALLSVMTFVGCGTPRISDTVIAVSYTHLDVYKRQYDEYEDGAGGVSGGGEEDER